MESAGGELIQSHPPPIHGIGIRGSGSSASDSHHHATLVSSSISTVQSSHPFHFPSSKSTHLSPSKDSTRTIDLNTPGIPRDLPKLISKESYLHFSGLTSLPHPVIIENGLFSPHLNSSQCPESGEEVSPGSAELSSSLQPPPHSANGTPMCIKRGPGRPRKDGAPASKCSNSLNKFKKFCSTNYVAGNVRGVRGRKKTDGSYGSCLSFGSNSGSLSDLGVLDGEMHMFTEDTMESDSSSVASSFDKLLEDFTLFPEQWPGKVCVFCNLGEKSMSGQGELLRLDLPPGFDPQVLSKLILENKEKEIGNEKSLKGPSSKRPKPTGKIKRLTSQGSLEGVNEPVDEVVGYPDEADLSLVFDMAAGHFYIHSGCALWCGGLSGIEVTSFPLLEPHLLRALSQRCSHCGNLGAGVSCNVTSCGSLHHLPCAATSGSFQEPSSQTTICSSHLDRVVSLVGKSANCTVCDEVGNLSSMIMCSTCGHHYHAACMALTSDPSIRAGWQCPACKMCQACRQPGDEGKLLACETCDKAYHIFCLRPALSSLPKHSWKCKMCRICSDCGARTPGSGPSSRWHGNFSVCDSCYQQRNKGLACPLCGKAYRHVAQKLMLQCHLCKKYVHSFCDPNADLSTYQCRKELYPDYEYICIPCKAAGTGLNTSGCNPRVVSTIKKASGKELISNSDSNSLLGSNFALSQDSLVFMEEDSLAGTESSIDLIWSDKARISLVPEEVGVPVPVPPPQSLPLPKPSPPTPTPPSATTLSVQQPKKRNGTGRPKTDKNTTTAGKKKGKGKGRTSDLARKRGPKPKMRGVFGAPSVGLQRPTDAPKGEDEPGVENRLVLCSSKDEFVLQQDVCVMCGAYGNDLEGRLISCAQCGQCYHPFCVNVKVTKVVLQKGWRCLDCTVCEGCGERHDEARLILCDDCDISFHIYCMNPPLDYVPKGNWKCKWCAICTLCGSNDPGLNSIWHKNYTLCGPCNSIQTCPVCSVDYSENELVIQCQTCDRWLHGACDVILTEEEAEKCADFGYQCVLCRPREVPPPHLLPPPPVLVKPPPKSPDLSRSRSSSHHTVDGVVLSSCGVQHIRGLSLDQPRKKRKKMPNIADMEAGILAAIESVVSGSTNNSEGEESMKSEDKGEDSDKGKDGKKRRNLQKFGVGGFVVRVRGPRFKDEDLESESQNGIDQPPPEKPKRKASRRKIKNKLIECFPVYLQEAFFGKSLMEGPQGKEDVIGANDEGDGEGDLPFLPLESTIKLSPDELKLMESINGKKELTTKVLARKESSGVKGEQKKLSKPTSHLKTKASDALRELLPLSSDLLDNDLVDRIMDDELRKGPHGMDDLGVSSGLVDDGELGMEGTVDGSAHKDELTDFLSSIDTGLPSMDSKDVEDIFKGVLTDESHPPSEPIFPLGGGLGGPHSQPPPTTQTTPVIPTGGILMPQNTNTSVSGSPTVQGNPSLTRSTSLHNVPQGLASPLNFPPPSPYHSEYSNSPQFSPAFSEPPSPWPTSVEGEVETPGNYSQRSILKWEVDEALGPSATISAVLYSNMNHPELKRDYQSWNERSKQIAKIWRSLPTDKRAPYLQKARENRAACRMQKAQQMPLENKVTSIKSPPPPQGSEEGWKGGEAGSTPSSQSPKAESEEGVIVKETRGPRPGSIPVQHLTRGGPSHQPTPPTPSASSSLTLSQPHRCFIVHINTNSPSAHALPPGGSGETKVTKLITRTTTTPPPPPLPKDPTPPTSLKQATEVKCSVADQQIRVLTPSEIMRTLPALSQETCGFPLLDQEKLMPPVKTVRGETQEERHWKQLQAYRQQQAQAQQLQLQEQRLQGDPKDHAMVSGGKHPYPTPGIPGMVQRQGSLDMNQMSPMDNTRQPLQVTTTQHMSEGSGGSLVSCHLQSPNTRQSFPGTVQGQSVRMRPPGLEMPPPSPSPHYSPKPGIPGMGQQHSPLISRSPIYSRMPYMQSPRPQMTSPNDPYGNPPLTPQPDPYSHPPLTPRPDSSPSNQDGGGYGGNMMKSEQYMNTSPNEMEGSVPISSPRSGGPQAQETRQQLRDLLQRQQIKKLEQDHSPGSSGTGDMTSPSPNSQQRSMPPWPSDDWQKLSMDGGNHALTPQKHNLGPTSPIAQIQGTQFRHPFLPQHARMVSPNGSNPQMMTGRLPGAEFRQIGPHSPLQSGQQQVDPRVRVLLHQQQQQQQLQHQQLNSQQPRGMVPLVQQGHSQGPQRAPGFPLQQQLIHSHQQGVGQGQGPTQYQVRTTGVYDPIQRFQLGGNETGSSGASSMLAQQLGRPLNPTRLLHPLPNPNQPSSLPQMQLLSQGNMGERVGADVMTSAEHQELPESVTAELEKLEEEQHRDGGGENDAVELADLGMDDDELLGMGADFNILEYADPELNTVVGGEKTNILDDNLDLEEEKEEEKELKRKEEKHDKKEQRSSNGSGFSSHPPPPPTPSSDTFPPTQVPLVVPKSEFPQQTPEILRAPQPPPYPGPPPPYPGPGRPQSVGGIRNGGGGLALPPVPPVMNMSMIFKNSVIGGPGATRRPQQTPLAPIPPSHLSNLPANQRRTLLLQEQPLLLEDLLEQEKREQQRQGPMLLNPTAEEPLLSDFDFERLKADVLSSNNLPQSLSPPTLPGQGLLPPPTQHQQQQQQPMYNRHPNPPNQMSTGPNHQSQLVHSSPPDWATDNSGGGIHGRSSDGHGHEGMIGLHPAMNQVMPNNNIGGSPMRLPIPHLPPPPIPSEHGNSEQDRQVQIQYEQWLYHQQQLLTFQLKHFDGEVSKLRKTKKSLNSKQRQLRKNGSELNENDGMELERVVKELSGIQKQLEQARKQTRQHGTLVQEYKNKQQKRQQMLSMSQPMGGPGPAQGVRQNMGQGSAHPTQSPMQASPLGNPNQSPLHSTPQSPLLSLSPSMSPLTHSPMASPMAPSPGPGSNSMVQTSPRGSLPGIHHMDDRPFSPKNNDGIRPLQSPTNSGGMMGQQNRIQAGTQHRMVNMGGGSPQIMQQNTPQQHMLQNRMALNMRAHAQHQQQQQQQRQMTFVLSANAHPRIRGAVAVPADQAPLRIHPNQQRYPHLPMAQLGDMLMRGQSYRQQPFNQANPQQQHQQQQQQQQSLGKPPGAPHYNSSPRVPFPVQSPTGVGMSMRSPSPLMQIGSPPGTGMMNQNRVSPASSPMRRPSGSGSVGMGSPLADGPKSVENPLTPRSGPHTPSGVPSGMPNMGMEMNHSMDPSHFSEVKDTQHHHQALHHQTLQHPSQFGSHGEMGGGGGGGGGSSGMIPYPTFSWFTGPGRLGLKGGSPFSVVVNGETHTATLHPEQTVSNEAQSELMSPTDSGLGNPSNGEVGGMGSGSSGGAQVGESQNALLKQLLQNTGCASTSQSSAEPSRFSLSNCLPTRPVTNPVPLHTSQLSEAATRIPQPTSISRQGEGLPLSQISPPPPQQRTIKTEPMEVSEGTPFSIMRNVVKVEENQIKEESGGQAQTPPKETQRKESFSSTLAETIDVVASDQTALDPALYEARRAEDEARKAKRRQYTAKRRQSAGKEPQTPKKRARKGSKMEEDYELYLETLMSQLRQLQPIGIAEPELGRNYSICGVPGMGDMSKLHTRHYSRHTGDLVGEIGNSRVRGEADYYYTFPFGAEVGEREKKPESSSTQRGFYNQEFASPRTGAYCDRESSKSRSPSPCGRDCDTPDTIVSSSSPEPIHYDKNNPFTSLTFISGDDEDEKVRRSSPVYELLRPIPLRPVPQRFEHNFHKSNDTDKENKVTPPSEIPFIKSRSGIPLRENGNVTVTLTLSSNAVDDVSGILRNLANILSISSPSGLQVTERGLSFTPPLNSGGSKVGSYTYRSKDGKEAVDIQSILNGTAKFCRHCDVVVLSNIIRKKPSDLPGLVEKPIGKEENGDGTEDYYFCSSACFMQFSMTHGIGVPSDDKAGPVVKHPSEAEQSDKVTTKESKLNKDRLSKATQEILEKSKGVEGVRVKGEDGKQSNKGLRYKYWTPNIPQPHNHQKYKKPTEKELTELLFRMGITVSPPKMPQDSRQCLFCHQYGDSVSDGPGRLLNLDVDKWVHLNCALWSEEVYETENGALVNAEVALKQSLNLECIACNQKGATVKCFKVRCSSAYHLGCATKESCVFYKNKTVYCSAHIPKGEKDNELTTLAVFRRVYIQRDENRQVAAVMHHADQHHLLRVGSLIFLSVGQLLPHQLPTFHTRNYIYPIGYKIVRFYWSMFRVNKRCQYICSIHEVDGKPEFRITVDEEGEERVIKSETAQGAWHQVLESIVNLRTTADSIKVFPQFITGEDLFGLTEPAIVKVLESLPGVETLSDYHFKYGRNPLLELPLAINPTGCARSEPKLRTHFKRPHTQRTGSSRSNYTALTPLSSSDAACPYSKQFVHSKSSQYRKMKQDWRNNVYLARSKIQGLGLYAARDIEKHTMVIEYIGEIIRSELAELREKRYESQNRGIYMFRVDENRVIDATLCGGLARYINHSCNPNCVAEQVEVERDIRIIIFTNRRIIRGEELSYDYKFEFEDDQHKIPCLCGAPNCLQWMN